MKASDLKIPCNWEDRRPLLLDRLLYIPAHFYKHEHVAFSLLNIFEKKQPIYIEYCSGNGQWIIDKAIRHPDINWIAVEIRFDRMRKIWAKMQNRNIKNLFVVFGEAFIFTKYYLPEKFASTIYVNFPDPWPKKRHAKHRLITDAFIQQLVHVTKPKARAIFVTDDIAASERMAKTVLENPLWRPMYEPPYYVTEWPEFGKSFFNDLWEKKGKEIRYFQFVKNE